ncbi:MAG: hypothetical protein JWL83_2425, partial [Actinomycetia bacterium]|nr:hypothetical protein [Actinomycetes bacterium]
RRNATVAVDCVGAGGSFAQSAFDEVAGALVAVALVAVAPTPLLFEAVVFGVAPEELQAVAASAASTTTAATRVTEP